MEKKKVPEVSRSPEGNSNMVSTRMKLDEAARLRLLCLRKETEQKKKIIISFSRVKIWQVLQRTLLIEQNVRQANLI